MQRTTLVKPAAFKKKNAVKLFKWKVNANNYTNKLNVGESPYNRYKKYQIITSVSVKLKPLWYQEYINAFLCC